MKKLEPIIPGEILPEEFLKPIGLSQYRLAKEIDVPAQRISEIVTGKRSITADTDLRLCRFFGLSNGYWLRALKPLMILRLPSAILAQNSFSSSSVLSLGIGLLITFHTPLFLRKTPKKVRRHENYSYFIFIGAFIRELRSTVICGKRLFYGRPLQPK